MNDVFFKWTNETLRDEGTFGELEALKGTLAVLVMKDVGKLVMAGAREILIMGIVNGFEFVSWIYRSGYFSAKPESPATHQVPQL